MSPSRRVSLVTLLLIAAASSAQEGPAPTSTAELANGIEGSLRFPDFALVGEGSQAEALEILSATRTMSTRSPRS